MPRKEKFSETMLAVRQVIERTGLSRASIYRLMKRGAFPAAIKIGDGQTGAVRWPAADITAWIESRPRAAA